MLERANLKLPLHNHSNPYVKCRMSVVSVRSTVPREVKVEISGAWGGAYQSALAFLLDKYGSQFYTLFLLSIPMERLEFPSTAINASAKSGASPVEQQEFVQPALEGLETEQPPEIELGNCIITASVLFRKLVRGNEWHCTIRAEPDLLHPEQVGDFEAHAFNSFADMAHSYHLRPGDRALMRGTLQQQTIALGYEEATFFNHFYVISIEVLARSKRTSIMDYEKAKTR